MDGYIEHHHSIPASSFGTLIQSVKAGERWGVGQHMSRFNGRPPASRRVPPWLALFLVASATTCHRSAHRQRTLPDTPLVIGYAHDCQSGKVDLAIEGGVNVVVWAFLHMTASTHHDQVSPLRHHTAVNGLHPSIDTSHLDLQCIRACRRRWEARGIEVTHLAAFGGWNGPHVDEHYSGAAWFAAFEDMNTHHGDGDSTLFDGGRPLFDGVDVDFEGNDDVHAPTIADFCQAAKESGLLVTMAPPESYLDALGDGSFSLSLAMPPLAWKHGPVAAPTAAGSTGPPPTFRHAGRNAYAWLLDELGIDTFAFVAIQLYEGWSRASHAIATTTAMGPPQWHT